MAEEQTARTENTDPENEQEVNIPFDRSKMVTSYANICLVMNAPEELILDFGLNTNPPQSAEMPIELSQRVIMSYSHAQRLLQTLSVVVQRHEQMIKQQQQQAATGQAE